MVQHLEEATGSVLVGQIGRTIIVYRPSLTKLKAEEKKRQDRRIYMRRAPELKADSLARIGKNKTLLQVSFHPFLKITCLHILFSV